jgi:hypothetical protein
MVGAPVLHYHDTKKREIGTKKTWVQKNISKKKMSINQVLEEDLTVVQKKI